MKLKKTEEALWLVLLISWRYPAIHASSKFRGDFPLPDFYPFSATHVERIRLYTQKKFPDLRVSEFL